jgi:signal transduction histidine kinase
MTREYDNACMRPSNSPIAGFIAVVLALLTASLVILSYRMQATLVSVSGKTDRAVKVGGEIATMFSAEVASIVGFQATDEVQYRDSYRAQRGSIDDRVRSLEEITPSLGTSVEDRYHQLRSAIDEWHQSVDSRELTTGRVPSGDFRRAVFELLFVLRRAQASTNGFNEAVLQYQSDQALRLQQLADLFMALAAILGPLALSALVLMAHVMRRLNATSVYMESRAGEEEALRQVAQTLSGGLAMTDVLHRITEATALVAQADDVHIQTVDPQLKHLTCIAASSGTTPPSRAVCPYEGSAAQAALQTGQPHLVQSVDAEGCDPGCAFCDPLHRSENRSRMVIPLVADNRPLGAICLMRGAAKPFTQADVGKVRIVADMAAMALHRALTVEKLQRMEEEERLLVRVSSALASLDYNRTLKTVAHVMLPQMGDWCILHLVEGTRVYHAEVACADPRKKPVAQQLRSKHRARPDLENSVETAIRTRQVVLIPELSDEALREYSVDERHFDVLRQLDLASAMVVPLTMGRETVGALLFLAAGRRRYNDDDASRARKVAYRVALAIHNAQLYATANDAIQSRDEVLRAVAHDLRSPLSTIQLSTELLSRNGSLPYARQQKMLRLITGASHRMNRLIDDLLAIGRLRAGQRLKLDLHREDPADIVRQACEMMEPRTLEKSIGLQWSAPWGATPFVNVDRSRILQVLTNLLDNSIKFTPAGGSITVSCELAGGEMRFAVKDTGKGIDPADIGRLFDLFWQGSDTAHLGAGLGLAIAKAVVEQHHGRIWVESTPGTGTTVTFTVPVAGSVEEPLRAA